MILKITLENIKVNEEFQVKRKYKKSNLYNALYICSPKMVHIGFRCSKSKGPVLVYSNYVSMEGLEIFKIYLSYMFLDFNDDKEVNEKNRQKVFKRLL